MPKETHKHSPQHSHKNNKHHNRSPEHSAHRNRSRSRSRDRRDRRDNHSYNHRDNYNHRNYPKHNDRNYRPHPKSKPTITHCPLEPPKAFVLSQSTRFTGRFKVDIRVQPQEPNRMQASTLGELKNKITPIQKLWSSHIKQYLNISEFVQIFRPRKSLAYDPIQYGKTIINYQQEFNSIVYSNLSEQSQIFSRAYFKLWEILQTGVMEEFKGKQLSVGCVAEGPGGFIHALIDYRLRQQRNELVIKRDTYHAITLKIDNNTRHAKDWSDPRGSKLFKRLREIGQSITLSYGSTGTGDLLKRENIEHFQSQVNKKCQLVTGDGGIECIGDKQFEYQQVFNVKLFLGEIITALHIQQTNGKFILKIYDCGFELTRQLIMLLALYYQQVQIIKPITSRPGNSEKYLLCEGFAGIAEEELEELKKVLERWTEVEPKLSYFENTEFVHNLFDFSHIPNHEEVYNNIRAANDWFVNEQIQKIEEGLQLADTHKENARSIEEELKKTRFREQMSFAYAWCQKYGLPTIEVQIEETA